MPNSSISIKAIIAVGSLFSMGALTLLAAAAYLITDPFSNNAAAVANTPTLRPVAMMVQHHPTVTYTPIPTLVPTEEPTPTEVIETETPTATATAQAVAQVVVLPVSGEAQPIANTATPIPPTNTAVPTPANTATSSAPTADWAAYHAQQTGTAQAALPTATPVPLTNTAAPATDTPAPTNTVAATITITATSTETETPTATATATDSVPATATATATPNVFEIAYITRTAQASLPALASDELTFTFSDSCNTTSGTQVDAGITGVPEYHSLSWTALVDYYDCSTDTWHYGVSLYFGGLNPSANPHGDAYISLNLPGYSLGVIQFYDSSGTVSKTFTYDSMTEHPSLTPASPYAPPP